MNDDYETSTRIFMTVISQLPSIANHMALSVKTTKQKTTGTHFILQKRSLFYVIFGLDELGFHDFEVNRVTRIAQMVANLVTYFQSVGFSKIGDLLTDYSEGRKSSILQFGSL